MNNSSNPSALDSIINEIAGKKLAAFEEPRLASLVDAICSSKETIRESREFWLIENDQLKKATGLSCAQEGLWFFPEIGTFREGINAFAKREDAFTQLRESLERRIKNLQQSLDELMKS